jgi:hypothetical protein
MVPMHVVLTVVTLVSAVVRIPQRAVLAICVQRERSN